MTKHTRDLLAALSRISNLVLATAGGLCALLFVFFLYSYSLTGKRQFVSFMGVVLYYIVPVSLAIVLFACLKFRPSRKISAALVVLSLAGSVYTVELLLGVTGFADTALKIPIMLTLRNSNDIRRDAAILSKRFGVEIDPRRYSEVIADLVNQGRDAVPFVSPENNLFIRTRGADTRSAITIDGTEVLPLGGIANRLTVLCNEMGSWVTYDSDEHGMNNPSQVWRSDPIAVAALGDSFTQGYCVPREKSFVGLIRKKYPATVNLGIAGNGPLMMLATAREYLPRLKPRIVLWFYYEGNDLTDLQEERRFPLLVEYLQDDFRQVMLARQDEIDQAIMEDASRREAQENERRQARLDNSRDIFRRLVSLARLSLLRQRLGLVQGALPEDMAAAADMEVRNIELFREVLTRVRNEIQSWGGTVYFVYLPSSTHYFDTPEIGVKEYARVLNLVNGLGISVIDLHSIFQRQQNPRSLFPFGETGHYNEKGHEIVAEEVLKVLSSVLPAQ